MRKTETLTRESLLDYELGRQLLASVSCAEAREQFQKALERSPNSAQIELAIGESYFFQEKPDLAKASETFCRVTVLRPDWAEGFNWLGAALQKQDRISEAAGYFERALALDPDDPRPRISLGVCLTQLNKYDAAINHLRAGIALKPHYAKASAHLFLAEALRLSGQIKAAREEWDLILTLPAEYPDEGGPHEEARNLLRKYGG